jgi:hypothetical protein
MGFLSISRHRGRVGPVAGHDAARSSPLLIVGLANGIGEVGEGINADAVAALVSTRAMQIAAFP